MMIEQLRQVHQATPFSPFTIYMADGRSYPVPHREFLSHSPTGRTVIVHHADDSFSVLDLLLVNELRVNWTSNQSHTPSNGSGDGA
jgi:hypothetical protein